jgi:hypothetical protein
MWDVGMVDSATATESIEKTALLGAILFNPCMIVEDWESLFGTMVEQLNWGEFDRIS